MDRVRKIHVKFVLSVMLFTALLGGGYSLITGGVDGEMMYVFSVISSSIFGILMLKEVKRYYKEKYSKDE